MKLALPWMLLAALPAACVLAVSLLLALRRRRAGKWGLLLRAGAVVLLAPAAAGLLVHSGGRPRAMVILDRSASMGAALPAARKSALEAGAVLGTRFDVRYASFAAAARTETAASLETAAADESGSNVGAAIEHALSEMRPGEPVLIVTDGQVPPSRVRAASLRLEESSPRFLLLPAGVRSPDAALAALDVPVRARPGEVLPVVVKVAGSASGPVRVRLLRSTPGGERSEVDSAVLQLGAEESLLRFEARAPLGGRVEYIAELSAAGDAERGNNSARAFVNVLGPIRVGVLAREATPLSALLSAGGLKVGRLLPAELAKRSAEFDVLVFENLSRAELSKGDRAGGRLADFVHSGGGLVMFGGGKTYASGGFYDGGTLEKALPASMRPPDEKGLFAVLVLDRSGSMGHASGSRRSKLDMVREAAGAIADRDAFSPRDRLAVVVFNSSAEVLGEPVAPAADRAAGALRARLAGVTPGGSTDLVGALKKALEVIAEKAPREAARHVILLSDGLPVGTGGSRGRQKAELLKLVARMASAKTTLSTVGTGAEDEDAALLAALARAGRGRFHRPADLGELAEVFRRDLSSRRARLVEKPFTPVPGTRSMPGIPARLPALEARNRISARKGAWVALSAPAEGGRGTEPLIVAWERGRGRAACFASGAGNPWNRAALSGATGTGFVTALARWAAGRSGGGDCRLELVHEAGRSFRLELVVAPRGGRAVEFPAPRADVRGLAAPLPLLQVSPSRYSARLELPPGEDDVVAVARDGGRELARGVFPVPYPREIERVGLDLARIRALARLISATTISSPERLNNVAFKRAAGRGWQSPVFWLIAAALLLILGELALRAVRR